MQYIHLEALKPLDGILSNLSNYFSLDRECYIFEKKIDSKAILEEIEVYLTQHYIL
jgi:hypothetical protein